MRARKGYSDRIIRVERQLRAEGTLNKRNIPKLRIENKYSIRLFSFAIELCTL